MSRSLYKLRLLNYRLPSNQVYSLQPSFHVIAYSSFSGHMATVSFDPDYARRKHDMRSSHIVVHKRSAFVAHMDKRNQSKLSCRSSRSVFSQSKVGSREKHGEEFLGKTTWICAEDMKI